MAATIKGPVQDFVGRHYREIPRTRAYASVPPAIVADIGRRRPTVAGRVVSRLRIAARTADVGLHPVLVHVVMLGMTIAVVAALGTRNIADAPRRETKANGGGGQQRASGAKRRE